LLVAVSESPVAVSPIVAEQRDRAIARGVEAELATALLRAGVCVTNRPENACYHLCGTLRGDGREHRLTFRLIEAATGRHLWAYQHCGPSEDIFLFEESAAASVTAAIQPGLRAAEVERARRKPDVDLTAQDLALRALPHVLAFNVDGNTQALDLLDALSSAIKEMP
jgi:TolB-like protein